MASLCLRRRGVRIWNTGVAEPNSFSPELLWDRAITTKRGTREPGSSLHPGWLYDIRIRDSDAVWRARIAHNTATFSRTYQQPLQAATSWNLENIPAMMFPDKDAELGVTDGAVRHFSIWLPPWQRKLRKTMMLSGCLGCGFCTTCRVWFSKGQRRSTHITRTVGASLMLIVYRDSRACFNWSNRGSWNQAIGQDDRIPSSANRCLIPWRRRGCSPSARLTNLFVYSRRQRGHTALIALYHIILAHGRYFTRRARPIINNVPSLASLPL